MHRSGDGQRLTRERQCAGAVEGFDFLGQGFADTAHLTELTFRQQCSQITFHGLENPRPVLVSPHLEGILPLQFKQNSNLLQHGGNFFFIHRNELYLV